MSFPLSNLVCGTVNGGSRLASSLNHLSQTLNYLNAELPSPMGPSDAIHPLFAPFIARSLLEVTCTALIARLDPFRVLTLAELQNQTNYAPGKRLLASVQWSGDVIVQNKNSTAADTNIWKNDCKSDQMSRALLGDYQEAILWRPAFKQFLDVLSAHQRLSRYVEDLRKWEVSEFVPRVRKRAIDTYSLASKGIHHEFVLPRTSYYDKETLRDLLEEAYTLSYILSCVANYCDHIAFQVSPEKLIFALQED